MRSVNLDDKYTLDAGYIFLNGRQALVRLPLVQRRLDRARNWNTAGFISGYRGSPLGTYDAELWKESALLKAHDIVFLPAINEDLAATAVWGTQQLGFLPGRKVDGVFSIWYGKGPGVDRSGDPLKHANLQGTEPRGGVLVVFGDDHSGKSSSTAHQSDLALAAHEIPVLYPATVAEVLEYGLAGIALSRYSGLLVGLKVVNETADGTAVVSIEHTERLFQDPGLPEPAGGVHARKEFLALQEQDKRLSRHKLPRATAFVRANGLDRIAWGAAQPSFVIATAGKAYADVLGALELLGIDEVFAKQIGIAVYKVAMIYPLEPEGLKAVAASAEEILFVEEKRPHMERQAGSILINERHRPRLSGKTDPGGQDLLPADVPLDPVLVARALEQRLQAGFPHLRSILPAFGERVRKREVLEARSRSAAAAALKRRPAFCAGCPHSTSTTVPEGSFGMTGIGCHAMAIFHAERNPLPVTHMGGEGGTWLGIAPFTGTSHVFQNLGDGTYNHSGSLAIRASVQARARITYKILYNDAVAMTGGQPVEGGHTVGQIAAQVLAEGVRKAVIVSDHPERFKSENDVPHGVRIYHRDALDEVQRELRDCSGVTVLIYDQTCAAEKRRRRKRGQQAVADQRIFINDRVCEGCGDCSVQSNCLAIQPLETELGRKRTIDQFACNQDFSCTKGFCPSFVTVAGARLKRTAAGLPPELQNIPEPALEPLTRQLSLLITGVGGSGVVTVSAVLGMAAHLEGHGASLYDMTGLSQKGGAVLSHVRLFPINSPPVPARIARAEADLLLACDIVAAAEPDALQVIDPDRTTVIANTDVTATPAFQSDPDLTIAHDDLLGRLDTGARLLRIPARSLAERLAGDPIATNFLMLGFAWQLGHIPLSRAAIERAIELNKVAVSGNLHAFTIGRAAAAFPDRVASLVANDQAMPDFDTFVARRTADLTAYHNAHYAKKYAELVQEAAKRESQIFSQPGEFAWAVARGAFKLMAYKDEYEVARLFTDGRFRQQLDQEFEQGYRLTFHMAPPLWPGASARGMRPKKIAFAEWLLPLLNLLARLRWLRETPFDVFGFTAERRLERALRDEYLGMVARLCQSLSASNRASHAVLAEAPLKVRGYGPVKVPAAAMLLARLRTAGMHST